MGFTPLDGLMMGTRSGCIDPGILTYLMRQGKLERHEIDDLLNRKSGLLGISGISSDMREIQEAMKRGHERASLAFQIYIHRLQAGIGARLPYSEGLMRWCSLQESGRTPLKCVPQLAVIWNFLALNWMQQPMRAFLLTRISPPRIPEFASS